MFDFWPRGGSVQAMGRLLRSTMGRRIIRLIVSVSFALAVPSALPAATIYGFDQTSASVPGLIVTGEMTINGGVADLPTLSNLCHAPCGPVDYGNLLAFAMSSNFTGQFTRHDLMQSPDPTAFPHGISRPTAAPTQASDI